MRSRHTSGFTLIEILVVISIVALVSGVATLSISQRESMAFASETARLSRLLQQASDRALIRNEAIGFYMESSSYEFRRLNLTAEQWELMDRKHWRSHDTHLFLNIQVNELDTFDNVDSPDILFFPGGEYSAFELSLESTDRRRQRTIQGDGFSTIRMLPLR